LLELAEPRLKIITAISNSEQEGAVVTLLHSQGCNIIYRALNYSILFNYLAQNEIDVCILYSLSFAELKEMNNLHHKYVNHRFIEVKEKIDHLQLINQLTALQRPSLIYRPKRVNNVVSVFGTPASPGISTLTNHLARLKSAKIIAATHGNIRPETVVTVDKILAHELDQKLANLGNEITIIDAGATLSLTKTLSDRRGTAHWLNLSLTCSAKIIYVTAANINGLSYLAEFINDFKNLINPPQIIYVLNQHRIDRQGQIVQKKFIELAGPVSNLLIPFERRIDSLQVGTQHGIGFWRSNTFTRQVEKIANQL
jgi:hypothetical protein